MKLKKKIEAERHTTVFLFHRGVLCYAELPSKGS